MPAAKKNRAPAKRAKSAAQTNTSNKRQRTEEELPHGLGTSLARFSRAPREEETTLEEVMQESSGEKKLQVEDADAPTAAKANQSALDLTALLPDARQTSPTNKGRRPKKPPYGHSFGETPFPDFHRPTPEECRIVNDLLTSVHGEKKAPAAIPAPSETFAGCGEVPSVLDALIRTVLSANTTGANSGVAIKSLIDTFGTLDEGTGKGSVDWDRVRRTPGTEVAETIKGGGNQHRKSIYIKGILDTVHAENNFRREALANPETEKQLGIDNDSKVQQSAKLSCADPNVLSLDHMHGLSYHEAFAAFLKYEGVALKTASCVCLYCLQRPSFAVDTHVQRITGWLGWRPEKSDENKTFSHLEYMIPDELKYSLHTLFVMHGKECVRCNAKSHEDTEGWEDGCVIDHLVKRLKNAERKKLLKATSAKTPEESGDEDGSVQEDTEDEQQPKPRSKRTAATKTRSAPAKAAVKGTKGKKGKAGKKGKSKVKEGVEGGELEDSGDMMQADDE